MKHDLCLRADAEADLIAALPMLRGIGEDGAAVWRPGAPGWALLVIGPMVRADAVVDDEGAVLTPAEMDTRCHANLLLDDERCPDATTILVAAAPLTIDVPREKRRVVWS